MLFPFSRTHMYFEKWYILFHQVKTTDADVDGNLYAVTVCHVPAAVLGALHKLLNPHTNPTWGRISQLYRRGEWSQWGLYRLPMVRSLVTEEAKIHQGGLTLEPELFEVTVSKSLRNFSAPLEIFRNASPLQFWSSQWLGSINGSLWVEIRDQHTHKEPSCPMVLCWWPRHPTGKHCVFYSASQNKPKR